MDISSVSAKATYTPAATNVVKAADPLKEKEIQQQMQSAAATDSFEKSASADQASTASTGTDAESETSDAESTTSAAVLESLEDSTSTSKYTAAEIAEYDTDGDGEIDTSEEMAMKLDKARKQMAAGISMADFEKARAAYETAMIQGASL